MDFKKKQARKEKKAIKKAAAMEIYRAIREHGNADAVFKAGLGFEPEDIKEVDQEGDRIWRLLDELRSGNYLLKPGVAEYDGNGNRQIISEAEYFDPESKDSKYIKILKSSLLEVKEVFDDYVEFIGKDKFK